MGTKIVLMCRCAAAQVPGFKPAGFVATLISKNNNMNNFKIVPLSKSYVRRIRQAGKDDFGHQVIEQTATGLGPCRVSLKPFEKGVDRRLLFTHSPFEMDNAYN